MRAMNVPRRLLNNDELATVIGGLDGWEARDGKLCREYEFLDFVEAIGFMMRAAIWAEQLNHHPNWSNAYKTVTVELWSHDLGGITPSDVELATKMNELAHRSQSAAL